MSQKIIFSLDRKDISRAIKEINAYKQEFQTKVDTYRKRIAEEIAVNASSRFRNSIVDDIIKGGSPRHAEVDVTVEYERWISVSYTPSPTRPPIISTIDDSA